MRSPTFTSLHSLSVLDRWVPFPEPLVYYHQAPLSPTSSLFVQAQILQDKEWLEACGPSTKRRFHWALVFKLLAKVRAGPGDLATVISSEVRPYPRKLAPRLVAAPTPLPSPTLLISSRPHPTPHPLSPLDSRLREGLHPMGRRFYDQREQKQELLGPTQLTKGGDVVHFFVTLLNKATARRALRRRFFQTTPPSLAPI